MAWTEDNGVWHRPLDCHDRLFQFTSDSGKPLGREHWLLMGNVQLEFPADVDAIPLLRDAWKRLRFQHPDIALELVDNEKRYEPVRSEDALNAWCEATFRIESDEVRSADALFSQQLRVADAHATCHWIPSSGQLALVSAHWRWDGRGLLLMLHELLTELESPTMIPTTWDGSEASRLVPSLDVVLGMSEKPEPAWEQRADELLGTFLEGQPSIGLLSNDDPRRTALPGDTTRVEDVTPAAMTTALRTAARKQGITLTSAMHASAIVETARGNPESSAERFISWAVFDLRKYCPPPFNGALHAPSLRMVGLPFNAAARAPWSELAQALHPVYHQEWKLGESDMLFVRPSFVDKAVAIFKMPPPPDMPAPSEPSINSLGVLDTFIGHQYGPATVKDVSFMTQMLSQQLYVHCWSWDGQLHLSASFNEAYYTREYVKQWLAAVKNNLVENLLSGTSPSS